MKYSKYEIGPYNVHIIKTDRFKTINLRIDFKRKGKKEELTKRRLLSEILFESTARYSNQRLLMIAKEDLYNQKISSGSIISGKDVILSFSTQFLHEKYTENGMFEKSVSFFLENIFEPDFKNDKFKEEKLSNVKKRALDSYLEQEKKPSYYAYNKMLNIMGPNDSFSFVASGYKEDLDDITITNLTDYYKEIISSDTINIFVVGDVNNQAIKKLLQERIPINTIKRKTGSLYLKHDKLRKRARKVKEGFDSKQSQLVIGSKIGELTDFERKYVLYIYNSILGEGPDSRLFNKVREKNSLCYSISSQIKILSNILIIRAGINKEDSEKAIRLIRKEINSVAKGLIDNQEINKVIISLINKLKEINNSPISVIEYYVSKEYYGLDDLETRIINFQKVDRQKVINFAKKIYVDTVFVLEGDG